MNTHVAPNKWGLSFHHLGLAAQDPHDAARFLTGLGYAIGAMVYDPLQNVNLWMCTHDGMPDVEIIGPAEGEGPLDKLLARHSDGLVYHICYTSANLEGSIEALEADETVRVFPISPPKEAVLFGGRRVSFYLIAGMGLIEIIDEAA